jgi:hypothetical protein
MAVAVAACLTCVWPACRTPLNTKRSALYTPLRVELSCLTGLVRASLLGAGLETVLQHSFIHSCYTCSRSSFEQRQPIPNAADQRTCAG